MNMPKLHNLSSSSIKTLRTISNPAIDPPILETQLQRCRSFNQFNQILSHTITSGFLRDTFTSGELLKFSTGAPFVPVDYSLHVLTHLESSNGFLWNTLMRSQIRRASPNKVMGIYKSMLEKGVRPDHCTHPVLVQACALRESEIEGAAAHGHALKLGFDSDLYVRNNLIRMYSVCGSTGNALKVFDESPVRDLVSWNSILAGYARAGDVEKARWVFESMPRKDSFASNSMIALLGGIGCVEEALRVFMNVSEKDIVAWSSLISCYRQNAMFEEALLVFVNMISNGVSPDEVVLISVISACAHLPCLKTGKLVHGLVVKSGNESYVNLKNALIHMYSSCGDISEAEALFSSRDEFLDNVSWNSMITGYLRSGFVDEAKEVFEAMPGKGTVTWSAMVSGFAQNGRFYETLALFLEMVRSGFRFDETTLASVVSAYTHLALLEQGRSVQALMWKSGITVDPVLGAALIDMYMKCGCAEDGVRIFSEMEETMVSSWNTLILGLATNGMVNESLAMYSEMKRIGPAPDERTYIAVLGACRHMGLVDEGRAHFAQLTREPDLEPNVKHYGCMVDLLGRAGLLGEAEELVRAMPMAPDAATWGALLGACRMHNDAERGKRIGRELIELHPNHDGFHVLLSDIYASIGDWNEVAEIRETMIQRGMVKTPACSMIGANGDVLAEFLSEGEEAFPDKAT